MLSTTERRRHHDRVDPHVEGRWLSDVILGAQDGLANTLGVVLGIAAASAHGRITFAAGLAAGFAEALSMGAVAYTSSMARGELYGAERAREYRHVERTPDIERAEIRLLYANKGFSGALLRARGRHDMREQGCVGCRDDGRRAPARSGSSPSVRSKRA